MRNRLRAVLGAYLCISSVAAFAQTQFGVPDCGQWVAQASVQRKAWLLGYLSGLNTLHEVQSLSPKDPLSKLGSADQAFLWVSNFCRENPLKDAGWAGWKLFEQLKKQ
jgi:hypothetical protein